MPDSGNMKDSSIYTAEAGVTNSAAPSADGSIEAQKARLDAKSGNGEYHDVFWYAVQALKENAMQSTYVPVPDGCEHEGQAECGGCATCGFKCGKAFMKQNESQIPGSDPFAERNAVDKENPPLPETTFPLPQVVICVAACIAGCYLAQQFFMHLFGG